MVRKVGAAASRLCRWVVPVRGSPAITTGGRSSMSSISGCRLRQIGQQEPVLEQLQQLPVEVDHPGVVQAVDLAQCGEVDVEPFAVVLRTEIA